MRYLFMALLITLSMQVASQAKESNVRSIEVKGSSEIEITPDEIFVQLTLKEYKKAGSKIELNTLESELVKAIKKLGIAEEKLTVENVYGYNWNWKKQRAEDFLGSKTFLLELSDLKKMNDLIEMLAPEGVNSINVRNYSHSAIEEYRKKVKVGAMQAAKEKATYLLQSIDANLGQVLQVQEIDYSAPNLDYRARSNYALEANVASSYQSEVDFKKIKVRAEMRVVFEID
ncbi:MAG: SIMPL domain-containing protein [Bacteroidota bacterium]